MRRIHFDAALLIWGHVNPKKLDMDTRLDLN